jgi:hypothetical protein
MIGQTFNRLCVVAFDRKQRGYKYYRCRCTCGAETTVREDHLRDGTTRKLRMFEAGNVRRVQGLAKAGRNVAPAAARA